MSKRLKLCSGAEAVQKFKKKDGLRFGKKVLM